jgi:hypothetical protein
LGISDTATNRKRREIKFQTDPLPLIRLRKIADHRPGILPNGIETPNHEESREVTAFKIVAISFFTAIAFKRLDLTPCHSLLPSPFIPANH